MKNKPLITERLFDADKALLWRVITEKELMKQWYFDVPEFKAEIGFTFEFTAGPEDGKQYKHLCEITEVIPEQKLSYTWKYDGYEGESLVTFQLFEEGKKTRLKLTHSGIETFPEDVTAFALHNFEAGWEQIINRSLSQFISKHRAIMQKTQFTSEENKLTITRQFEAPLNLVWKAWTTPELLDQWWAPKPWISETKHMEFKEGGHRLYAMVGPKGEKHWALMNYKSIVAEKNFSGDDAFCDEEGNINEQFPVSEFVNNFSENNGKTEVVMLVEYASKEHLVQILKMGMKEGLSMAFVGLDELLKSLINS